MNVSYEATEIIVSFIEMFLLFRIYGIILRKHKRRESTKQGIILAIIGTAIMHICNYIAVFHISIYWCLFFLPALQHCLFIR